FAGCISATTNVTGPLAAAGWRARDAAERARLIGDATAIRTALAALPLIAAVKWALGDIDRDPGWNRLCPPLRPPGGDEPAKLGDALGRTSSGSLAPWSTDGRCLGGGQRPPRPDGPHGAGHRIEDSKPPEDEPRAGKQELEHAIGDDGQQQADI